MTAFVGIDLAWGTRNPSGICVLDEPCCRVDCAVQSAAEIARLVNALGADVVVGIDAPLIIEDGRSAEAVLARRMGRYGVYAHSSAAALRAGYDQGIRLAYELAGLGFSLDPRLEPRASGRFALEVYPHAGHVVMFGLDRIMPYKHKSGRTAAACNAELARYRNLLSRWIQREAPDLHADGAVSSLLAKGTLTGRARKRHEDELDALTCALMAMMVWREGIGPEDVLGDDRGYIAVPGLARDRRFSEGATANAIH
ncbi:MAG: DUF429 domain-containing protein [Tepidiformaceae bacterium]